MITLLHLAFMILIDKVTAFAPDEANYIGVFNNLYEADFSLDGYLGWQEGSINVLRVMYSPAKLLEIIGFSEFYSVRSLSILYSMLSLYLLLNMAPRGKILKCSLRFWIAGAYCIPSFFLWTSLGLRENFIFLSLVSIFYILVNPQNLGFGWQSLLLVFASTLVLVSKNYLFWLLLICFITAAIFLTIIRKKPRLGSLGLFLAFLVPIPLFPSVAASTMTVVQSGIEIGSNPIPPTAVPYAGGQTLQDLNEQLDKNPILSWITSVTGVQGLIQQKAEVSYPLVSSQELSENFTQLQREPASLRDPLSIFLGVYGFLFIPTPFVDNGSFFLNVQSYESFIWYIYYVIFIIFLVGMIRGRYSLNLATLSSSLFCMGFTAVSALIEVNDGTSVRHRAVLLVGILIMLATFQRSKPSLPEDQSSQL